MPDDADDNPLIPLPERLALGYLVVVGSSSSQKSGSDVSIKEMLKSRSLPASPEHVEVSRSSSVF